MPNKTNRETSTEKKENIISSVNNGSVDTEAAKETRDCLRVCLQYVDETGINLLNNEIKGFETLRIYLLLLLVVHLKKNIYGFCSFKKYNSMGLSINKGFF